MPGDLPSSYFDRYKEVKILNHSAGSADTLDYLLLPAGVAVPAGHAHAQVIRIPVQSMIVMGSTHIAQADFAGVADRITGVGNGQYVDLPRSSGKGCGPVGCGR